MINVALSLLHYYPSFYNSEHIALGVLFYCIDENIVKFKKIKRWSRVSSFDDEANIKLLKLQLDAIENEVENNLLNPIDKFDIYDYTRFYVNELQFSEVTIQKTKDKFDEFVDTMTKFYLNYDFEKKHRLTKDEKDNVIKNLLDNNQFEYTKGKTNGYFTENVKFDYLITKNNYDYGIKIFNLTSKNILKVIPNLKTWAYNAYTLKDSIKSIFLYQYDLDSKNDPNFDIAINILKKESFKALPVHEGLDFILKELNNKNDNLFDLIELNK